MRAWFLGFLISAPFKKLNKSGVLYRNYEMWDTHQNTVQPNGGDKVLAGDKQQGEQNYEVWDSHQSTTKCTHRYIRTSSAGSATLEDTS